MNTEPSGMKMKLAFGGSEKPVKRIGKNSKNDFVTHLKEIF